MWRQLCNCLIAKSHGKSTTATHSTTDGNDIKLLSKPNRPTTASNFSKPINTTTTCPSDLNNEETIDIAVSHSSEDHECGETEVPTSSEPLVNEWKKNETHETSTFYWKKSLTIDLQDSQSATVEL